MKTIKLRNDKTLPSVGFGTYLIKDEDAEKVVFTALENGYRHIDTGQAYGNERGVGNAIKKYMMQYKLSRDELYITTKLWPGNAEWGQNVADYDTTISSLEHSLKLLELDYVDLYLIHAPFKKEDRLDQWRALVELKKHGKAKSIGVSNYDIKHIQEIKEAGMELPDANQIELHPWSQKNDLVAYLKEENIGIIAYSSLLPLSTWRVEDGQVSAKTKEMSEEKLPFEEISNKYNVSEAQLLLKWGLQNGYGILPKSMDETRIKNNIDLFNFEIEEKDMRLMSNLDRGEGLAWQHGDPTKVE